MVNVFYLNRFVNILKKSINCVTLSTTAHHSPYTKLKKETTKMERKWQPNQFEIQMQNKTKSTQQFKLLSYNILAQDLLVEHLHLYYNINKKLLHWNNRLSRLKEEIAQLKPDIMCLQEMQYDHLKDLVDQFSIADSAARGEKRKLEYVFKKKTGTRSDGCAIIYDKNKFKLISERFVEYYTEGINTLNRENIALIAKFQITNDPSDTQFVVGTTHLLYNPKREDVRIAQVNKLLPALINFCTVNDRGSDDRQQLPAILTGDFNFTEKTRAFEILTALRTITMRASGSQNGPTKEDFQMDSIDFGRNGASTYQQDQWLTVDYILKSRSMNKSDKAVQVNSKYQLLSAETCRKYGQIPNEFLGSDHFSLAIEFSIS